MIRAIGWQMLGLVLFPFALLAVLFYEAIARSGDRPWEWYVRAVSMVVAAHVVACAVLALAGCGSAAVVASDALTEACVHVADKTVEDFDRGELTQQEALDQVACARRVCLEVHGQIREMADE